MQQLVLPVRHEWLTRDRTHGQIAVEPFEPGFALTVGNAYRRVLLSSIPGAAPTWAKIEGVLHEFSHLQGVNEDTLDIIMNLRKLGLRGQREPAQAPSPQGAGTAHHHRARFRAGCRRGDPHPRRHPRQLDKDGTIEMELCVERGRGYQAAERREPEALPINAILIDSDFCPVKRVNFTSSLEAGSGMERLVLEVWTNGSVTPRSRWAKRPASSRISSTC
jgi:DNA-directed RNA polymerase subunit alpha